MAQETTTLFESAIGHALTHLTGAHAAENHHRATIAELQNATNNAIAAARQDGDSWDTICLALHGMSRQAAHKRLTAAHSARSTTDVATAWNAERSARAHMTTHLNDTAAAIAVCRQAGATWEQIGAECGHITRRSMLKRLADWHGQHTLNIPPQLQLGAGNPPAQLDPDRHSQQACLWWDTRTVQRDVTDGVHLRARHALAEALNNGLDPHQALQVSARAAIDATERAVAAVEAAADDPGLVVRDVATLARDAALSSGRPAH